MNLFHQLHLFVHALFVMFGTTVLHILSPFCLHVRLFKKPRNVKLCRLLGQFMNPKVHNEVGPIGAGHNLHVHACGVRPLHSRIIYTTCIGYICCNGFKVYFTVTDTCARAEKKPLKHETHFVRRTCDRYKSSLYKHGAPANPSHPNTCHGLHELQRNHHFL